jgi:hypothetical protein
LTNFAWALNVYQDYYFVEVAMRFSRSFVLLFTLLFMAMSKGGIAADHYYGMATKADKALRGAWYGEEGTITFKNNGTIKYKGKRYFYAVSNGGIIQLSGKHSVYAIPYQLAGNKLTLMEHGRVTVYTRKR